MEHTESTKIRPIPTWLFVAMTGLMPFAGVGSLILDGSAAWIARAVVAVLAIAYVRDRLRAGSAQVDAILEREARP